MDVSLGGAVFKGDRLMEFLRRNCVDRSLDEFGMPFAAVATSLQTGAVAGGARKALQRGRRGAKQQRIEPAWVDTHQGVEGVLALAGPTPGIPERS